MLLILCTKLPFSYLAAICEYFYCVNIVIMRGTSYSVEFSSVVPCIALYVFAMSSIFMQMGLTPAIVQDTSVVPCIALYVVNLYADGLDSCNSTGHFSVGNTSTYYYHHHL